MKLIGKTIFLLLLSLALSASGLDVNNETHSGSLNIQDPSAINVNNSTFTSTANGEIRSDSEIIINPDTLFNESGDILITAEGITAYTITFVAGSNGSITGDLVQFVSLGQSSTQVIAVADSGYAFTGWSDGGTNPDKVVTNPSGNLTLTANFADVYTVTFTAGVNGTIMGDLSQTIVSGDDTSIVYAIPINGYKFVNWSDGNTNPFRVLTNVTASQALTANFTATTEFTGFYLNQNFDHSNINRRTQLDEDRYYPGGSALEMSQWNYQYDGLGNVSSAQKVHSTDSSKNLSFTYSYDDIGNRGTAVENGSTRSYTSNDMNQYTSINVDSVIENIQYDNSGNPLTNGDWSFTWDGEDRVKTMTHATNGIKLEFEYDFRGFRLWKKVFLNDVLQSHVGYIYDGNLVTEEIDFLDNQKIIRSYTWGLDPAGTQQQVGGIGALVSMEETQADDSVKTFHVVSDAGGNVTNLVESHDDGSLTMANSCEYGPFGQIVSKIENVEMPYQFNTKMVDAETGLNYYGYRFYDSADGRWLNRDPIGVNGGINIYNSVSNNMVNGFNGGLSHSGGGNLSTGIVRMLTGLDPFGLHDLNDGDLRNGEMGIGPTMPAYVRPNNGNKINWTLVASGAQAILKYWGVQWYYNSKLATATLEKPLEIRINGVEYPYDETKSHNQQSADFNRALNHEFIVATSNIFNGFGEIQGNMGVTTLLYSSDPEDVKWARSVGSTGVHDMAILFEMGDYANSKKLTCEFIKERVKNADGTTNSKINFIQRLKDTVKFVCDCEAGKIKDGTTKNIGFYSQARGWIFKEKIELRASLTCRKNKQSGKCGVTKGKFEAKLYKN